MPSDQSTSITSCTSNIVHLNCTFDGADPLPVVTWYKDNYLIGSNADNTTSERHNSIPSTQFADGYIFLNTGALEILSASLLDAGSYHCTGTNAAGTVQGNQYNLNVVNGGELLIH